MRHAASTNGGRMSAVYLVLGIMVAAVVLSEVCEFIEWCMDDEGMGHD